MKKSDNVVQEIQLAVHARLQALLFSGAALGASLLMLAGGDLKLPKVQGE